MNSNSIMAGSFLRGHSAVYRLRQLFLLPSIQLSALFAVIIKTGFGCFGFFWRAFDKAYLPGFQLIRHPDD